MPPAKRTNRYRRGGGPIRLNEDAYRVVVALTEQKRQETGYQELSVCSVASAILIQVGVQAGLDLSQLRTQEVGAD